MKEMSVRECRKKLPKTEKESQKAREKFQQESVIITAISER